MVAGSVVAREILDDVGSVAATWRRRGASAHIATSGDSLGKSSSLLLVVRRLRGRRAPLPRSAGSSAGEANCPYATRSCIRELVVREDSEWTSPAELRASPRKALSAGGRKKKHVESSCSSALLFRPCLIPPPWLKSSRFLPELSFLLTVKARFRTHSGFFCMARRGWGGEGVVEGWRGVAGGGEGRVARWVRDFRKSN